LQAAPAEDPFFTIVSRSFSNQSISFFIASTRQEAHFQHTQETTLNSTNSSQ
jgi:hypothetical protein